LEIVRLNNGQHTARIFIKRNYKRKENKKANKTIY